MDDYKDVPGGWYKEYDYTIRVGSVVPTASGRRHWAAISLILQRGATAGTGWQEVLGRPEQQFYGETERSAFRLADEATKAWLDIYDDARWSGVETDRAPRSR